MFGPLIAKFVGLPKWVQYLGYAAGIALAAGITYGGVRLWFSHHDKQQQQIGATSAVSAGQKSTLNQVGKANEAGNQIRDDRGDSKYAQCVRDVAPGFERSCDRYRKQEPVSH